MITIYSTQDTDYATNGRAVLAPVSCDITGEAAGKYELDIELPKDDAGKWKLLTNNGWIIKAPVPGGQTELAVEGDNAEVWKVKDDLGTRAQVRSQPKDDTIINYAAWGYPAVYTVGDRCTYNNHNYQLTADLTGAEQSTPPPSVPAKWAEIARTKPGAPILDYLAAGTEFYKAEDYSAYWMRIQTYGGVEGYVRKSACVYVRTISAEDIEPRVITEQLFRIKTVTEQSRRNVAVWCQHVSYDHNGNMTGVCKVNNAAPASAIARMKNALLWDPECTIATNLKEEDGAYTGDLSKKNLISALLDPDKGIVSYYKARIIRDNWDFFLYKNTLRRSPITITYGGNLVGVTVKKDTSKLITRVRPIAKAADGKTDFFLDGAPWVDSPILNDYPVITLLDLDIDAKVGGDDGNDGTWTEETLRAYMREQAEKKFSVDNVDKPTITMTVEYVNMGDTAEYAQYKGLTRLHLYDTVHLYDPEDDIDTDLFMTGFKWDAVRCRYKSVTFANSYTYGGRTVAGFQLMGGCIDYDKLAPSVRVKLGAMT